MRVRGLSVGDAVRTFVRAVELVRDHEHAIATKDLLDASLGNRITAYDLEFVVLAQTLGEPLVTFDKQVLAAFPAVAIHPNTFVAR